MDQLRWCVERYKRQIELGNYFLHEHPYTATSWNIDFMAALMDMDNVYFERGDMCPFGMNQQDADGVTKSVLKATGWATNSEEIAKDLNRTTTPGKNDTVSRWSDKLMTHCWRLICIIALCFFSRYRVSKGLKS